MRIFLLLTFMLTISASVSAELNLVKELPWTNTEVTGATGGASGPPPPLTPDQQADAEAAWGQWVVDNSYSSSRDFTTMDGGFTATSAFPTEPYPVDNADSLNFSYSAVGDISSLSRLETINFLSFDLGCCPSGPGITDITPLSNLTGSVNYLNLNGNSVTDLTPLSGITQYGELEVTANELTSLAGLEGAHVETTLDLLANNITDFSAAASMTFGTSVTIRLVNNPATNLSGFESLTQAYEVDLYNMDNLTSLDGLDNLTTVSWDFTVEGDSLSDISALRNLTSVGGDIDLRANSFVLLDVSALENLASVGGSLLIDQTAVSQPGFVGIPSSAPACQPENSGWFSGATQAEVCQ